MASVPTEDDSDAKHPSSPSLPASSPSLPLATPVVPTPLPPPAFTTPEHDLSASLSSLTLTSSPPPSFSPASIRYDSYASESQLPFIQSLIDRELSEPYSVFTYRYFLNNWPHLCLLAMIPNPHPAPASASFHPADLCVGTIICKLSSHFPRSSSSSSSSSSSPPPLKRGYIAMLATAVPYRRHGVGVRLVELALERMRAEGADVVVLETEVVNGAALRLYEGMGFVRDARLRRYYLNGGDAFRLKLWTTTLEQRKEREAQKRAKEKDHVGKGKAEAGKGPRERASTGREKKVPPAASMEWMGRLRRCTLKMRSTMRATTIRQSRTISISSWRLSVAVCCHRVVVKFARLRVGPSTIDFPTETEV